MASAIIKLMTYGDRDRPIRTYRTEAGAMGKENERHKEAKERGISAILE